MQILHDRRDEAWPQVVASDGTWYYNVTHDAVYEPATNRYQHWVYVSWGTHLSPWPSLVEDVELFGYVVHMADPSVSAPGVAIPITEPFEELDIITLLVRAVL